MNGVHCQISATMIVSLGVLVIQSGWGGLSEPNSRQTQVIVPLSRPYSGLKMRVLPQQRGRDRHDEERGDEDRPHEPAAPEPAVEHQREREPQHQRHQHDDDRVEDRVEDRVAQVGVGERRLEVVDPGEPAVVGVERVPVHERDDQRRHERQLGHDDHEDEGGEQRCTGRPRLGFGSSTLRPVERLAGTARLAGGACC